ncbi:glycoside hydrolase family 125 protein [Pediococcus acidilactici]|nr:glycoside hydrolase family 125 protein [Pediococcus acidilactici]
MEEHMFIDQTKLIKQVRNYAEKISLTNAKTTAMFKNAIIDTISNTVEVQDDRVFIATGDIPAMWLRDSTFQVLPYLSISEDIPDLKGLIHGVINQQLDYVNHDPYANAFNKTASGAHFNPDHSNVRISDLVWERKFEIDSLCAPLLLAVRLYEDTGYAQHFTDYFWQTVDLIVDTFIKEQHHEHSEYFFERDVGPASDTLSNAGRGTKIGYTGMVWSGFRPSDDACKYGYFVPGNMMIVTVIEHLLKIMKEQRIDDAALSTKMNRLANEVRNGSERYGVVELPDGARMFAYEVDGLGNYNLMDDANVPSLLAIPFIGYTNERDAVYVNTRKFILSSNNPYYYQGTILSGIGSPHTPQNYVWPIALAMEGLTTSDLNLITAKLNVISQTDANTNQCHEGIDVNNPDKYTREWFSWANMTFCQLAFHYLKVKGELF